ncbi:hypothetical protein [Ramlibacter rhizophilus]|uniref:Uncharacterized protein n=1 Tax=Ramlibacter rhizophilus TaxID=1781167 RepID=A0A4Z0BH60_9BURK|nr:hypothetical protein [Ramlibacter rhizophilus]TFY98081.1 hypothetical protein EZ242_16675 [Ramlibacter rhizophilus]
MIHHASDPKAAGSGWRPSAPAQGKDAVRTRPGHAWPFLSKPLEPRPVARAQARRSEGGS